MPVELLVVLAYLFQINMQIITRIDHTYDYLVWLTLATDCCQKNIKIGCTYIPQENSTYVGVRNDYFTMLEEEVARYIETHHILLIAELVRLRTMELG